MTATIFDIQRNSYVDGPGIRTTVFFKGCNLRCAWCHNPESQSAKPQLMFYRDKCSGCGKCKEKCPHQLADCSLCGICEIYCPHDARRVCGKDYTVDQVMDIVRRDKAFYEASEGGVTLSGGECMLYPDFVTSLLIRCKEEGIHTAVDTAGNVPYESFLKVLPYTDLFLYDVKCLDEEKHRRYTGVGNGLILDNLFSILESGKRVWIRIPVIPTVNDSEEEIRGMIEMIKAHGNPERIELLPYHAMGENKYTAIGKEVISFVTPDEEKMNALKKLL